MDHDQNFKNLILDYPAQALAFFAADEAAAAVDASARILPVHQEQLKYLDFIDIYADSMIMNGRAIAGSTPRRRKR